MILSPIKCFLIQLTLTFVVFFYNTLAQTEKYEDPDSLKQNEWCNTNILRIYEDQLTDDELKETPDYIYVCIGICINTLQSFTSEGYNKTDDTIQETMNVLASEPAIEGFKPVVEAYKLADKTFTQAQDKNNLAIHKFNNARETFLLALEAVKPADETYTSAKTHFSLACTNKYVDDDEKTKLS